MASFIFGKTYEDILKNNYDPEAPVGTLKWMLVGGSAGGYTPNKDTDEFKSDVTDEYDGSGYVTKTSGAATLTLDAANDRIELTLATTPVTWSSLGNDGNSPGQGFILFDDTGVAGTSRLICFIDQAIAPAGGDLVLNLNAEGTIQFPY